MSRGIGSTVGEWAGARCKFTNIVGINYQLYANETEILNN